MNVMVGSGETGGRKRRQNWSIVFGIVEYSFSFCIEPILYI